MDIQFLPFPRHLTWLEGSFKLEAAQMVLLNSATPQALRFSADKFRAALKARLGLEWGLVASSAVPANQIGLTLMIMPEGMPHPEGYHLRITPEEGIVVHARDAAGVFYAICTLTQLLEQIEGVELPCLEIKDWPDFSARGVMLDISRDKVPQLQTLFDLIDRLASWKVNQVQLYTEHTFAYQNHPEAWAEASPMTGEDILALDAFCRERYIELVLNQNSFGHLHHWLKLDRYAHLAEIHGEFDVPWGKAVGPFSITPVEPGSLELVRDMYDELLPHFTSKQVNVGCDETFDLGNGKSKALCEERGVGQVYLDFLLQLYTDVTRRGYTMQFWGDIIIRHPELVSKLPRNVIALEWGYDADHPFDEHGAQFAAAGVPFYVCPGTSSWCTITGRTDNALGNLRSAAENGLKHGATGYLNTDWGDRGHWQYLPVSYLGLGMGAAYAWCLEANQNTNVSQVISRFAFDDPSGTMGQIAYDLGNIYRVPDTKLHNSSVLFWILQGSERGNIDIKAENFEKTLEAIDEALAPLDEAQMARPDAELIKREFANAGRMLRHACYRILMMLEEDETKKAELLADLNAILEEHKALWLARNRPGGLKDSLAHFDALLKAYA